MQSRLPRLLATCCLAAASFATAAPQVVSSPATLAVLHEQIDTHIKAPRFTGAAWGIAVVSLDTGKMVYAHDADRLLQPASTAKLYTAALTLSELGADYRIPTRLLAAEKQIKRERLDGPLILYGMGDPTLGTDLSTIDWADRLATQLAARGIHRVHGDLIADDTYFASPAAGAGWEAIDLQSWFAVPSSALSVQENQFDLMVNPGPAAGTPARLIITPPEAIPPLVSSLSTRSARTRNDINLYRAPGDDTLYAFGSIAQRSPSQHFRLSVADPAQLAGEELLKALARHGVSIDGHLKTMHWPRSSETLRAGADMLAEVQSPPAGAILQSGLKRSQNLYLQNLLLITGAQAEAKALQSPSPPPGFITTEAWGIKTLRELLDRIGIAPSASLLEEGTGLSRRDLTTPNAMTRLLAFLAAQPYAATLRDALPIAGVDGTLIGRMRKTPAANNVRAKTGSMAYVHCLAGYLTSAAGERLAFAIMLNNYDAPADSPSASRDVDAIAVMLAGLRERSH